jgi:sodium-dependent dicarboxylate transporter 2/3/5
VKRPAVLLAGPAVSGLIALAPLPGLAPQAHTLAAILACVVLYWILEPIPLPVTALVGTAVCVLAGVAPAKAVFAAYSHPIIFLFIGSFFLAEAMAVHGVDRRIACWMLSMRWIGGRPSRILLALGATTAVISMWISNTAATALILPVALGVLSTLERSTVQELGGFRIGLLLMLSYGATAGGMGTLIGTPPNLIGAGLIADEAGRPIPFLAWMAFGVPIMSLLLAAAWLLLDTLHRSPSATIAGLNDYVVLERAALGPWTRGQRNATIAFATAVALWVLPGFIGAGLGPDHPVTQWLDSRLPNELVALLSAALLFILPAAEDGTATLSWRQATDINWGIILLFGGGMAFGDLMSHTGLSSAVGTGFITTFGAGTIWTLTAVAIVAAILVSELTSNTASASMLVPLAIGIAQAAGVSPVPPAVGATLGASMGFALPVSTGPNAIVYGTTMIPMRRMIVAGLLFDAVGAVLIWLALRLVLPALGVG